MPIQLRIILTTLIILVGMTVIGRFLENLYGGRENVPMIIKGIGGWLALINLIAFYGSIFWWIWE